MSVINITLSKFDSDWDGGIKNAKKVSSSLSSASDTLLDVVNGLHRDIVRSRNINSDLRRVSRSIDEIEGKITDIRNFLLNSAKQYLQAQEEIKRIHKEYNLPYKKNTWQKIKEGAINVGKAIIAVLPEITGVLVAIGAVVVGGIPTGVVAAGLTAVGIVFSVNELFSAIAEEWFDYEFNVLKFSFESFGVLVGSEFLQKTGTALYHIMNFANNAYNLFIAGKGLLKLPSIGKMIKGSTSGMYNNLKNIVINAKNSIVGLTKSCNSWTSIKQNIIKSINDFMNVGIHGMKTTFSNSIDVIKSLATKGKKIIVGGINLIKSYEIPTLSSIKDNLGSMGKYIFDNRDPIHAGATVVKNFLIDNSISGNVSLMQGIFDLIFPGNDYSDLFEASGSFLGAGESLSDMAELLGITDDDIFERFEDELRMI